MKNKLWYSLAGCLVLSSFLSSSVLACGGMSISAAVFAMTCDQQNGTATVRFKHFKTVNMVNPMVCACSLTLAKSVGEIQEAKVVIPGTDTPIVSDFVFAPNPNTIFPTDPSSDPLPAPAAVEQQGLATTSRISVDELPAELVLNIKLGSGQSCNSLRSAIRGSTLFAGGAEDDGTPSDHIGMWGPPLPIELIKYSAIPSEDTLTLNWLTGSEVGVLGYRVLRGEIQNVEVVSDGLIPNQGQGNTGASYSYDVPNVGNGVHAYILEVLNADGSSTYHINEESILVDGKKPQ